MSKEKKPIKLRQEDLDFITDVSQGELMRTPKAAKVILLALLAMVLTIGVWAYFSNINEIVRGQGKAIPISHTQVIQNLDGGIIESILVREGQTVKKGELLMVLDSTRAGGSLAQSVTEASSLLAEEIRLAAEVTGNNPEFNSSKLTEHNKFIDTQVKLYKVRQDELHDQVNDIHIKTAKARQELTAAQQQKSDLEGQAKLIQQQLTMNEPLLKLGAVSRSVILDIKQQLGRAKTEINQVNSQIPELKSEIESLENEEKSELTAFKSKAQAQLSDVRTRLDIAQGKQTVGEANLDRTHLRSPVDGVIQKLYVNTIGGVASPGVGLIDVIPIGDELLVEVKIKPKDIGFVRQGQKAKVKVSAFDFAVYGGLDGTVDTVSADTIVDKKGNSYYLVKVHVENAWYKNGEDRLNVIPGMMATVDVSVAERSVLQYILKPLLRVLRN